MATNRYLIPPATGNFDPRLSDPPELSSYRPRTREVITGGDVGVSPIAVISLDYQFRIVIAMFDTRISIYF